MFATGAARVVGVRSCRPLPSIGRELRAEFEERLLGGGPPTLEVGRNDLCVVVVREAQTRQPCPRPLREEVDRVAESVDGVRAFDRIPPPGNAVCEDSDEAGYLLAASRPFPARGLGEVRCAFRGEKPQPVVWWGFIRSSWSGRGCSALQFVRSRTRRRSLTDIPLRQGFARCRSRCRSRCCW